jgi:excisionase family DNA binding protein
VPDNRALTVADVAARLAVKDEVVLGWIRSGELRAVNVASAGCHRPRWRIATEALELFQAARRSQLRPPTKRPRKRRTAVVEFF